MTKKEKRVELIEKFAAQAREYHRTHDVVLRREAEERIREAAPTRAYAEKVIRNLYN